MFNKISQWCNKHQGIFTVLSLVSVFYINWVSQVNNFISNIFNISLNKVNTFFQKPVTVGTVFIFILIVILFKSLWNYLKKKEIKVISAIYYTATSRKDITDRIQKIVQEDGLTSFQIDNITAGCDPQYGVPKNFDIVYEFRKQRYNKTFNENDIVDLLLN